MDLKMEMYNHVYKEPSNCSWGQHIDVVVAKHSELLTVAENKFLLGL